jgi:RHS repeat-associated protein
MRGTGRDRAAYGQSRALRHGALFLLGAVISSLVHIGPGHFGATTVSASSVYESAVLADSPSAYYRLGESSGSTAADDSGNGNNATYDATVTYGVTGALSGDSDTAIHGDGSHTPVTGSDSWTPTGASSWTVEGWIKSSSTSAKMLASWGDGSVNGHAIYFYMLDATHLQVSWSAGTNTFTTTASLSDGNWHYLTFTFDGTIIDSYVDGNATLWDTYAGTAPSTMNLTHTGSSWGIGGSGLQSTAPLDEVAVYPSTLSAGRINAHWAAGIGASSSSPSDTPGAYKTAVLADSPSSYYRLDEASGGTTAYDKSGNGHDETYGTGVTYSAGGALLGTTDNAMHGDGTNAPVTGSDSWTPTGASSWTVEAWMKSSDSSAKELVRWGDDRGSGTTMNLYMSDATHVVASWSAGVYTFTTGSDLSDGNWHDLAWTFDGSTLKAYVDSVATTLYSSSGTAPSTINLKHTGNSWAIGGGTLVSSAPIDEVALFPAALSATRITAHYVASGRTAPITTPPTAANNPTGHPFCLPCAIKAITASVGMPVNTKSGNFYHTFTDVAIPGRSYPLAIVRTYNSQNASTNSPFGYGWSFNYGMSLSCSSTTATITQEDSGTVSFTTGGSCSSGTWTSAAAYNIATLSYSGGTWTFKRQGQDTYTFNSSGQLTSEADLNGYTTSFSYTSGDLTAITDPAGRTLTLGWTGSDITSVTDANVTPNRTVSYTYNGSGELTDVTDVSSGDTHFAYDGSHRVTTMKDPVCEAIGAGCPGIQNHYDGNGRVDWQKDQLNHETDFSYSGTPDTVASGTTTITDPVGNVTVDGYQYGVRTYETRGYGTASAATTYFGYDPGTLVPTTIIDPNGNVTTQTVDSSGNVLTTTDPLGRVTTSTYNSFNELLTREDGKGVTTTNTYDGNGNLTSTSTPASGGSCTCQVTTYNHADGSHPGDVTSIDDPNGKTTSFHFDSNGYVDQVKDPVGNVTGTQRNADGWVTNSWTPKANCTWNSSPPTGCSSSYKTVYTYFDQFGDVGTVTDPLSHVTTYAWDADGTKTSVEDGNSNTTTYTYDAANRLTTTTRPDSTTQVTDYNDDSTVLDQKDGKGNAILTYGYDALGRVTTATDALSNVTAYTYDANGNKLTQKDPGGNCATPTKCTTMTYDADNELKTVSYSDGVTPNVTNVDYDADGQRTGMTDGTGTSAWTWDNLHRSTGYTTGNGATVSYGYGSDLKNQVGTITYPNSVGTVTQTWNDDGTLASVEDWNSKTTTFGYDANANLHTTTVPSTTNVTDTFGFNAGDQMTSVSDSNGSTLFSSTYGRDSNGQVSSDSSQAANQQDMKYTALSQLCYAGSSSSNACASAPANSYPYGFDNADNLTTMENAAHSGTNAQQFNNADELCWTVSGASANACGSVPTGGTAYTFDNKGNRTHVAPSAGAQTCNTYDQANRLTEIQTGTGSTCTSPTTVGTYAYDGSGIRESKTVSGTTTQFTWDGSSSSPMLLQQYDGTTKTSFIYGPGGVPVEQIAGSTTTYLHHDDLGSTRLITDSAGATGTATTQTWDPYGNSVSTSGSLTSPFGFGGAYLDGESGLYYAVNRYYDSTTGQWLTRDPAVSRTMSPYAYVMGNPLNMTDPFGLEGGPPVDPGALTADAGACGLTWEVPLLDLATCGSTVGGGLLDLGSMLLGGGGGGGSGDGGGGNGNSGGNDGTNNGEMAQTIAAQSWAGHSDSWRNDWNPGGIGCENDLQNYIEGVLNNPDDSAQGNYGRNQHYKAIAIDSWNNTVVIYDYTNPSMSTAFVTDDAEQYMQDVIAGRR